jgi:hypothetical protein
MGMVLIKRYQKYIFCFRHCIFSLIVLISHVPATMERKEHGEPSVIPADVTCKLLVINIINCTLPGNIVAGEV